MLLAESGEFAAREMVKHWLDAVAQWTSTLAGEPLRLPQLPRPGDLPFHKLIGWEEASGLAGEDREFYFGQDVDEAHKQAARMLIEFFSSEARSKGLSTGDKRRLFTVALTVWPLDQSRAKGLLWVMDKEYPHTREGTGREWSNPYSKEFMIYAVLFPPPIVLTH
jgi:hypothetical protein